MSSPAFTVPPSKNLYVTQIVEAMGGFALESVPTLESLSVPLLKMPQSQPLMVKAVENTDELSNAEMRATLKEGAAATRNFKFKLESNKRIRVGESSIISFTAFSHASHQTYGGTFKLGEVPSLVSKRTLAQTVVSDLNAKHEEKDAAIFDLIREMHYTGGYQIPYTTGKSNYLKPCVGIFDYEAGEKNGLLAGCFANDAEFAVPILSLVADFLKKFSAKGVVVEVAEEEEDKDGKVGGKGVVVAAAAAEKVKVTIDEGQKRRPEIEDFADFVAAYRNIVRPHANVVFVMSSSMTPPVLMATKDIAKNVPIVRETGADVWLARCIDDSEAVMLQVLKNQLLYVHFDKLVKEKMEAMSQASSSSGSQSDTVACPKGTSPSVDGGCVLDKCESSGTSSSSS